MAGHIINGCRSTLINSFLKSNASILSGRPVGLALFQTYAPLNAGAKHPIQKYGFDYIEHQKGSARPLSPHLQIYKPQWTWYVSGGHRMTGMAMGTVVAMFSIGMMSLPFDFTTLMNFFYNLHIPAPITCFLKFIIAYPVVFHALNGVRFLGFDIGYGLKLETIYLTAYSVVGISAVLALALALWKTNTSETFMKKRK